MTKQKHAQLMRRGEHGFSLIELMMALAIIGILTAVAYPSYAQYVLRTNRANAKAILMESSQFMERYYTTNNTYVGGTVLSAVVPKGAIGSAIKYNISFTAIPSATAYILQAVRAGSQAGDTCGTLTLSNTGAQTAATTGCW